MDSTRSASTDEPSRRLIDTTPLPMALLTASGAIEHLNPKFLETFGYTAAELPDLAAWWPLAYPDAQYRAEVVKTWCGRLGSVRAGEELPPFRARVTCRDGRVREIEWRGTLLGPHVLVVGADQTEPQRALEALRASDQRYRVLLETAPEAIVVYDVDRRLFVDSNPAAERLFQCPREELHRYGPAELSPAVQPGGLPSPQAAAAQLARALAGEVPVFEWMHRDTTGRDFLCEVRLLALPDAAQRRLVRGSILDISERKRAEDELREREERFRLLVENSTELVAQVDREGTVVYASPNHLAITGHPAAGMIGRSVFEFIHPADAPAVRQALAGADTEATRVFRYRFQDGSWHWLESAGRRFRTSLGTEMAAVISRDITERVRAEETRRQLEAQLREAQKMEAIGTLAGGIAHDFNNILTGLFGSLQLAQEELPERHPARPLLAASFRACVRARDLVAKILMFSRRREQQIELHPLAPIVREAVGLLRASLPATIEIREELAATERAVACDPVQIHQVLMNLGTNAAYAMRDRGGVLRISLDERPPEAPVLAAHPHLAGQPLARLTVADNGTGMDAATRARIFEPFFTTKPVGEGTGLGLAVVHGIVEKHRGAIAVDSAPGAGTAVHVWLPAREVAARGGSNSPFPVPRGRGERILFIDDEAAVCDVGARILERLGYVVSAFQRPAEALAALRREPAAFALVVSDLTMPELTGAEVAQEVRRLRPELPLLITTGYLRATELDRARTLGVRHFLEKPFTVENLAENVRRALDER